MNSVIRYLNALAWPSYPCQMCVGQEPHHGCYCAYYEALRPMGDGDDPPITRAAREALRLALALTGANRLAWSKRDQTVVLEVGRDWASAVYGVRLYFQRCGTLRRSIGEAAPVGLKLVAVIGEADLLAGCWWRWRFFATSDAAEIVRRRAVAAGVKLAYAMNTSPRYWPGKREGDALFTEADL